MLAQSTDSEVTLPVWIRQVSELWATDAISDAEFLSFIESILNKQIIPAELEQDQRLKYSARNLSQGVMSENPGTVVPSWFKNIVVWWSEGRISDLEFLRGIHHMVESGYIRYSPEVIVPTDTDGPDLEWFLPDDKEIQSITGHAVWSIVSTEYELDQKEGVTDSAVIVLRDITRVYEPVMYKFKVPSMIIRVSTYDGHGDLYAYLGGFENDNQKTAYMYGRPNNVSECLFDYTAEGAVTACIYENMIIEAMIYDIYNEHFEYDTQDLVLDQTEPTSRFMGEILKKISAYKKIGLEDRLHIVLQIVTESIVEVTVPGSSILYKNGTDVPFVNGTVKSEGSDGLGVDSFSCLRDDFGLVTISGRYINDGTPKDKVEMVVSFYDRNDDLLGEESVVIHDIKEFEQRRFIGHTSDVFHSCSIRDGQILGDQ